MDPLDKRIVDFPFTLCRQLPKDNPIVISVLKSRNSSPNNFLCLSDFSNSTIRFVSEETADKQIEDLLVRTKITLDKMKEKPE
jgi:hypothetical protein